MYKFNISQGDKFLYRIAATLTNGVISVTVADDTAKAVYMGAQIIPQCDANAFMARINDAIVQVNIFRSVYSVDSAPQSIVTGVWIEIGINDADYINQPRSATVMLTRIA